MAIGTIMAAHNCAFYHFILLPFYFSLPKIGLFISRDHYEKNHDYFGLVGEALANNARCKRKSL